MNCCQCQGIEQLFDDKVAKGELKHYRKKGPAKETRMLLDTLLSRGIDDATLLDIGGGVGAIQHELLDAGVGKAVNVDASTAYLSAAQQEAERREQIDRVTYLHGNFVDLAPELELADIVTLDRVICCYHDMPALVSLSSDKAKRFYAVVFPRDNWLTKMGFPFLNIFMRLKGNPFRVFIHATRQIEAIIQNNRFTKIYHRKTLLWQVLVFERQT